jgi:hypothetical protein
MKESKSVETQAEARKAYEAPKLRVYGDIRNITGSISDMLVVADGGSGMTNKS